MKREMYEQAMEELEALREHLYLHVAGDLDQWTGHILATLRRAVGEQTAGDALDEEEETILLTEEPPQPVT